MPEVPEISIDKREWTCPECDYVLDLDMEPQPDDVIECSCGAALLVEDDLSLTPGELSGEGDFVADDEPELVIDQEDEEDDPDEEDEEEEPEP